MWRKTEIFITGSRLCCNSSYAKPRKLGNTGKNRKEKKSQFSLSLFFFEGIAHHVPSLVLYFWAPMFLLPQPSD